MRTNAHSDPSAVWSTHTGTVHAKTVGGPLGANTLDGAFRAIMRAIKRAALRTADARVVLVAGSFALGACEADREPYVLDVIGSDYALISPDTVPAGPAILSFENRGKQAHEMVLARIQPAVSNREFADSLLKGARMVPLRASGSAVLFASPGTRNSIVRLRTEFTRGERYALWCQFRDAPGAPKHNQMGMFKLISVR